jgi:hypothetical protein
MTRAGNLRFLSASRGSEEWYTLAELADALGWPREAAPFIWMSGPDKLPAGAQHLAKVLREYGAGVLAGEPATFARVAETAEANREAWTRFYAGEGPDPRRRRVP